MVEQFRLSSTLLRSVLNKPLQRALPEIHNLEQMFHMQSVGIAQTVLTQSGRLVLLPLICQSGEVKRTAQQW